MSRKVIYTLLYIMLAFPSYAQQDEDVFDDNIASVYEKAIVLNDSRNYMEAYRQIVSADNMINTTLSSKSIKSSLLSDWEFLYRYWPVKKSKAEIAYMLGLYTDMEMVSDELLHSLNEKMWGDDISGVTVDVLKADLAKIDGSRFFLTENYDSSEAALIRALRLGSFPGQELFVCKVYDDLAQLYYKQGYYEKALAYLDSIIVSPSYQVDSRHKEALQNIYIVKSQRAICMARLGCYDEALKEIEPIVQYFKKANDKRSYAEALRKKAKILMMQYDATGQYSPEAVSCYQQYLSISRNYIDNHFVNMSESEREQYWMAEQPFVTDCFRLESKAPGLLYDVALYSKAVLLQMGRDFKDGMTVAERKKALSSIRINWKQVRAKLPADGCAIEFIVYEKNSEDHIGAIVLNKRSFTPVFIDIAPLTSIKSVKLGGGQTVGATLTSTRHEDKDALYASVQLPNLIWNEKLVEAIGQDTHVYFAADGIFHQLAIEYLIPDNLSSKRFYRLTSTRLLTESRNRIRTDNMLMCGGVDYTNEQPASPTASNDEQAYSMMSAKGMSLSYLNGSKAEIDTIEILRNHRADMVLRADSATETVLRELMGKYHLILISTHGYFTEAGKIGTDIKPAQTDTQLSQCCLFLAGAEKNMRNQQYDASRPDGILSARELAGMDLSDVDLATLSACQSGMGTTTVDGVFGLQRGLKTAGVKAVIASLWEVDDQATITLMSNLYANLEKKMTLHDAFFSARHTLETTKVTKRYPRKGVSDLIIEKRYNKPRFYNAFILIDGLE